MADKPDDDETDEKPQGRMRGQRPPLLVILVFLLLYFASGMMLVIASVFWVLAVLIFTANMKGLGKSEVVPAEIIGVRVRRSKSDGYLKYHPVYKYTLPSTGVTYETSSTLQHHMPTGCETGKRLDLRVRHDGPLQVRPHQFRSLAALMVILLVPGTWLFLLAARDMPLGMLALSLGIIALWTVVHVIPFMMSEEKAARQAVEQAEEVAELNALPLKKIEDVMASASGRRRLSELKGSGLAFLVIAILLIAGSGWLARDLAGLYMNGVRAEGTVTDSGCNTQKKGVMSHRRTSTTCHASFAFIDAVGKAQNFTPATSSSLDLYTKGDKVTVLYLLADPAGSAMVDKGVGNIQWPLFLFLVSVICFYRAGRNLCAVSRYPKRSAK